MGIGEHADYSEQNSFKPERDGTRPTPERDGIRPTPMTPEDAERILKNVGKARRRLVFQGKHGTTFSPPVTQDPLLDIGLELLKDAQKKEPETEN